MRVINYGPDNVTNLPVSSAGTALVAGALMARGITGTQPYGHLRISPAAGTDVVGILRQSLVATTFDTDAAGTIFTLRPVQLAYTGRVVRVPYSNASGDTIAATQAVSTTTMTLTSLEDDIDTAFFYVQAGLGAGQMNYATAAAAGSCTLKAAFGTSLDTTSKLIKILPRFHQLAVLTTDGTGLSTTAAVGTLTVSIVDSFIERNGDVVQLDPTKHSALTGLNSLRSIRFHADVILRNTFAATID